MKPTSPVTPLPVATPPSSPLLVDVQSEKSTDRRASSTFTPPAADVRQSPPTLDDVQLAESVAKYTPPPDEKATPPLSPVSPGEKIVLNLGPKAANAQRYRRDYVIGGTAREHHVTKKTIIPRRYIYV